VLEILNPRVQTTPEGDLEFLEALASDVAVAYEKAALTEQLRGEVLTLRQVCTLAGAVLAILGLVCAVAATYVLLARALPLREVAARPAFWIGFICLLVGGLLVSAARSWLRLPRRVGST
jgi:hypothetical protein